MKQEEPKMTRTQAQILLNVVEDSFDIGTDTISEMRKLGAAHAQRLLDEEELLNKAVEINRRDQERFASYLPQKPATLRQAISQGQPQQLPPRRVEEGHK
jgi:hypothetical protein